MTDLQNTTEIIPEVTPELTPEAAAARRQQDLECLNLLQQAHELRMETDYVDRMLAALKGSGDDEPPVAP